MHRADTVAGSAATAVLAAVTSAACVLVPACRGDSPVLSGRFPAEHFLVEHFPVTHLLVNHSRINRHSLGVVIPSIDLAGRACARVIVSAGGVFVVSGQVTRGRMAIPGTTVFMIPTGGGIPTPAQRMISSITMIALTLTR